MEEMMDELDLTEEEIEEKTTIIKKVLKDISKEFNDHGILSVEDVYNNTGGVDVRRVIKDFEFVGWTYGQALGYIKSLGINFIVSPTETGYVPEPTDNKYYHNFYGAADRYEGKYRIFEDEEYPIIFMQLEFFNEADAINVCKEALLDMVHDAVEDFVKRHEQEDRYA